MVGNVDGNESERNALAGERRGGFFAGRLVARAQEDRCAGSADLACDFKADALVRSGDQCNLFR